MHKLMGGRKETVSDAEILQLFEDADEPILSTSDVADLIDFSNRGANTRLYRLHDQGHLGLKQAGKTNVWWITDAGREYLENVEE